MNLIKKLISCVVAFACVAVPMNSITPIYNNVNAVEEMTESPIWDGTADISWYDDDETEFHLSTAEELAGLFKLFNDGKPTVDRVFFLENDIIINDTSNYDNWNEEPPKNLWDYGSDSYPNGPKKFNGTIEGNGHQIIGLYGTAFLDTVSEQGKINNIIFDKSYSNTYGGIADIVYGTISNCSYHGLVERHESCELYYYRSGSGNPIYASFTNRFSSMEYTDITRIFAGGICGWLGGGTLINCSNHASIICSADASDSNVRNFGNWVYLRVYSGGICGIGGGKIINCCNYSDELNSICILPKIPSEPDYMRFLKLGGGSYDAGICGGVYGNLSLNNCYNIGNGKIIGEHYNEKTELVINNTYNISDSICKDSYVMSNCFYLNEVATSDGADAKAKSKANMQKPEFAKTLGNAFVYVEGEYPKLAWELGKYITGDINNDGKIDISDAVLLQKYLLGAQQFTKEQYKAADINQDGSTDVFDMVFMCKLLISQL